MRYDEPHESTCPKEGPTAAELAQRVESLLTVSRQRYRRLWAYYRNPMQHAIGEGGERPYRQAQEWGMPARITGYRSSAEIEGGAPVEDVARKQVVVENDIAWRIETMIDFLFGKPIVIDSAAPDPSRRAMISQLLRLMLAHNGGILLLQQLALLGSVYGFVDVLVKLDRVPRPLRGACASPRELGQPPACSAGDDQAQEGDEPAPAAPAPSEQEATASDSLEGASGVTSAAETSPQAAPLAQLAAMVRLEVVEPARALPFLSPDDYRVVDAYAQVSHLARPTRQPPAPASRNWAGRLRRAFSGLAAAHSPAFSPTENTLLIDVLTPDSWRRYEGGKLVAHGVNLLGVIPLVHIQNTAVPFEYSGASDVEPLIPLQDELNTRLSDRAHRITMQSFKMYLGKGIEGFTSLPVAPGRMWMTDNDGADVVEFGGDAASPSEDAHIAQVREALDKTSGVTPIAAGAIEGRIGRLTSAAALRVTMQALLAKTDKKRTTYGAAIARMCELALAWLDAAGLFHTTEEERRVEINWPSPLPENQLEKLQEAEAKARLGVPREVVLRELGY